MSSIREQIAAKRAAAAQTPKKGSSSLSERSPFTPSRPGFNGNVNNSAGSDTGAGMLEDRTLSGQIKKAAKTGEL